MGHLDSPHVSRLTTQSHEPIFALYPLYPLRSSWQRQEVAPPTLALVAALSVDLSAAGGRVTHAWARATHTVHHVHVALPLAALAGVAALALAPSASCHALIQCREPSSGMCWRLLC